MIYAAIAVAVLAVLALFVLVLAYRVLKAAHRRPGDGARHEHSHLQRLVLTQVARLVRFAVERGVPLGPVVVLTVRGRSSGLPRTNPVDLIEQDGRRWLVATHEAGANWVRNLRAAGEGNIARGARSLSFTAVEVPQQEAAAVLQDVLGPRLARPVGGFVLRQTLGLPAGATRAQFAAAAAEHPVFELFTAAPAASELVFLKPARKSAAAPKVLIGVGLLVALVHAALGAGGVMTTGQWASGVIVGLLIAGLGNHLRIFGRRS